MAKQLFNPSRVSVIIPTLNAGKFAHDQISQFVHQGFPPSSFLVIDSGSKDDTVAIYKSFGAEVFSIDSEDFNHGGTRKLATTIRRNSDFYILLTQDAIPSSSNSLVDILSTFSDERVGMAYGRQLPRLGAKAIERHARLMNYPSTSCMKEYSDREVLGIKTVFSSNSFAAYRAVALAEVGSFPDESYFGEDQIVAGRLLKAGWKLAYNADSSVIHSHGYSIADDFRRYFDVGVFHARNKWILNDFGKAEGEGLSFLRSEVEFILKNEPFSLLSALTRTGCKYLGYRLGMLESTIPSRAKEWLSMQPYYWRRQRGF